MSEYNEEELQRPEDLLSRRRLAIKLAELCSETRSYSPVFLLDGKWGSGKTFVAQLLQEECADRNTEVFYIDSWRADYLGDPLSAIISSFTKELEERSKRQDLVARLKDGVARVARVAGPTLLNAVARAALGEKGAGKITDLASNSSDVIAAYLEKEASLEELRETLEEFAAEDGPVVVIIDELDRCVPTYAVQMLEVLAHIFRIPGFCFILSAYREELEKTVRHVYGVNFDAGYFLDRFVDFSVEVSSTVTQKEGFLGFHLSNIKRPEEVLLQNLLCAISANVDGLDLRSCKQFIRRVEIIMPLIRYPLVAPYVLRMKHRHAELFDRLLFLEASFDEVSVFLEEERKRLKLVPGAARWMKMVCSQFSGGRSNKNAEYAQLCGVCSEWSSGSGIRFDPIEPEFYASKPIFNYISFLNAG